MKHLCSIIRISLAVLLFGAAANAEERGDTQVSLEGGWENYLATNLKVKRTISIERDGQSHQADVTAPVLFRRGAVFFEPEKIAEMLQIKSEIEALNSELAKIRETAKVLGQRYRSLIKEADGQVASKEEPTGKNLGGVVFTSVTNENSDQQNIE